MEYISPEQFKKKYGDIKPQKTNFAQRTKSAFGQGLNTVTEGVQQFTRGSNGSPLPLVEGVRKLGQGLSQAAFSPVSAALEPALKPTIGRGLNYVADKVGSNPSIQKFANSKAGMATSRVAENIAGYADIAGTVGGLMAAPKAINAVTSTAKQTANKVGDIATQGVKPLEGAVSGLIPNRSQIVNSQVAKAFDLTQGDVKNLFLSTGNDVGEFVAKNNLIGKTVDESVDLINKFKQANYDAVRSKIAEVSNAYRPTQVPRFREALNVLFTQTADTPGLQQAISEISSLIKKRAIKLTDVQRVKELIDDHFSLYKATGDVKEGVMKQGLSNIRKDIRQFIENEVKSKTGADIKALNNSVATSKGLLDAIEARSTRGLTRYNIGLRDLGIFAGGGVFGGPLTGAALVFGKKILENPSVRLRIAKWLDGVDQVKKVNIQQQLKAGKIPTEFRQFIKAKGKEVNDALNESSPGLSTKNTSNYKITYMDESGKAVTINKMTKQDAKDWAAYLSSKGLKYSVKTLGTVATAGAVASNN